MDEVLKIDDILYSFLDNSYISFIPITELLPTLKQRVITLEILYSLNSILSDNILSNGVSTFIPIVVDDKVISELKEDGIIIQECSMLVREFLITNLKSYDIYDLIRMVYLLSTGGRGRNYFVHNSTNKFVMRILEHPKVDPLVGSILLKNNTFIDKYLDDKRSNKFDAYRLSNNNKIKDSILLRIFFCRCILPNDIYRYILLMEIL